MKIFYHKSFKKHFKKRISPHKRLEKRFYQRLNLLIKNRKSPSLKNHQLKGRKKYYSSFYITGDIRVIYKIKGNTIYLYDIGTHAQVY